jgi:hypothetical protein
MIVLCSVMINSLPGDLTINYNFTSGTFAPPYKFQYTVSINSKGEGSISYSPDHIFDTVWTEKFRVPRKNIRKFWKQLKKNDFFANSWVKKEQHPIGGSVEYLEITASGKTYRIPAFPEDKDKADIIISAVKKFIPKEILESFGAKKDKMIEEYKKPKG